MRPRLGATARVDPDGRVVRDRGGEAITAFRAFRAPDGRGRRANEGTSLWISPGADRAISRDVQTHPDSEVAGLIAGPRPGLATTYLPARNAALADADRGRRRFEVEGKEALRLLQAAWAEGLIPVAWLHSHPTGRQIPSLRDRLGAWPDLLTVIATPVAAGSDRIRLSVYRPAPASPPGPDRPESARASTGGPMARSLNRIRCVRAAAPSVGARRSPTGPGPDPVRTSRQSALPEIGPDGQRRLARARVLVLGVGGLGTPAALYLSRVGLGTLGLSDGDRVDATNLGRQVLFGERDIATPKAETAAHHLAAAVGDGLRVLVEGPITEARAAALLCRYDLVVHGTDLYGVRDLVNRLAVRFGIPWVDASVYRWTAQVTVYVPGGPCYRCLYPTLPAEGAIDACDAAGVPGPVTGVAGTLEALEAMKLAAGIGKRAESEGRTLLWDGLAGQFDVLTVRRRPHCPVCGTGAGQPAGGRGPEGSVILPENRPDPGLDPQAAAALHGLTVSAAAAARWTGPILDLRPVEWQHRTPLPGSQPLPLPRVDDLLDTLRSLGPDAGSPLLVCMYGIVSAELALAAEDRYPDIRCLEGGVESLLRAQARAGGQRS